MAKRNVRHYGLFEKVGGRWILQSKYHFPKAQAVRVFQNRLLDGFMSGRIVELRPVKPHHIEL